MNIKWKIKIAQLRYTKKQTVVGMGRKSKSGNEAFSKTDLTVHKHLRDPAARCLLRLSGDRKPEITENSGTINIEMAFFFPPSSLWDFLNLDLIIESQWIKHNTSNHC